MRMKDANQLKAKIKNVALQKGVDPRVLMRVYMMERFLDRVSRSRYKDNFVLKGGMLISYLVGVNLRTTMDIDTTMQNISLSEDDVHIFISDVISINIDDGVKFTLQTLDSIMQESDYPGVRASLIADFDGTKTPVKIDISTGHAITPSAMEAELPLMFSESISLLTYPIATILAEKLQTILVREEFNTRMRDFYDLHALRVSQGDSAFKREEIAQAFYATSQTRDTLYLLSNVNEIFDRIKDSEVLRIKWKDYKSKAPWAKSLLWEEIMQDMNFFLMFFHNEIVD
ncbi:nucleotidyl transferase AbiEii/AbiGii toxin family protein [Gardnerella sp. 2492-Sm]|uniref:nucleotidyl transferase AbiEii/AbiGii toxin family protein n=1 Tax=unclassified Gardnerella TaxID=2628112 RepID=UPI003D034E21